MKGEYRIVERINVFFLLLFLIITDVFSIISDHLVLSFILTLLFSLKGGFIVYKEKEGVQKFISTWLFEKKFELKQMDIHYVSILKVRKKIKVYSTSSRIHEQVSSKNVTYAILLIVKENNSEKKFKLLSKSREEALKLGLELGVFLNKKVLDISSSKREWLM